MHTFCAVELDWHANDRRQAIEDRAGELAYRDLKGEVLDAILTGTGETTVPTVSSLGKPMRYTLSEAVAEAMASPKAEALLLALLKTPAGAELAECIACEHADTYADLLS